MPKQQKTYTKEFKLEAVRLSSQPDSRVSEVARDLGIPVKYLYRWRAKFKDAPTEPFPGKGHRTVRDAELERLQREVQQLRLEQEILKKAAAFFARPLLPGVHS